MSPDGLLVPLVLFLLFLLAQRALRVVDRRLGIDPRAEGERTATVATVRRRRGTSWYTTAST